MRHIMALHTKPKPGNSLRFLPNMKKIFLRSQWLCVLLTLSAGLLPLCAQTNSAALVSVNAIPGARTIGVWFGAPVDPLTATNPASYVVLFKTNAPTVTDVTLNSDASVAYLHLSAKVEEFFYVGVTNLLDNFGLPINDFTLGAVSEFHAADIGDTTGPFPPGSSVSPHPNLFQVTVGGTGIGGTDDRFHFIAQPMIGNFDVSANITRLDWADNASQAGLMAREDLSTGSRSLQIFLTPTNGLNDIEATVRTNNNGTATSQNFQSGAPPTASGNSWLRLTRTNNVFTALYGSLGSNGVTWTVTGVTTQAFTSQLNLGLAVSANTTNLESTTAEFSDVQFNGTRPGDLVRPQLSAQRIGTNYVLSWHRTPRDFAVQATTNLASATNWNFLLLPIVQDLQDDTLRSMAVPEYLIEQPMFFRLARVQRVIPDPPLILYTGIILSPGLGLSATTSAGSLCSYPVFSSYAQTETGDQVIAPKGTAVTFTTAESDPSVDSVLQVRNSAGLATCDDNSAGAYKARILATTTATSMTNTYNMTLAPRSSPAAGYNSKSVLRVKVIY